MTICAVCTDVLDTDSYYVDPYFGDIPCCMTCYKDYPKMFDYISKRCYYAEMNRDRFREHLERIAYFLDEEWIDGDFPIKEVLAYLDRLTD